MRRLLLSLVVGFAAVLVLPWDAHAQAAIAGVVKDGTGAALPGVTVEASSPAGEEEKPDPTRYGDWEKKGIAIDF